MGGIGKTSIAAKFIDTIKYDEFQYIVWKSLKEAPPIQEVVSDLIKILSNQTETDSSEDDSKLLKRLVHHINASRCLIVFDNFESVLKSGFRTGAYSEKYESYGRLLSCFGEYSHKSCLLITS